MNTLRLKPATLMVAPPYLNNKVFDAHDKYLNRDDCLSCFRELKNKLGEAGFLLATQDIHPAQASEVVIYSDMPKKLPALEDAHKSYLIIFESELIVPRNWKKSNHQHFRKIFTWDDRWVDNQKYFKINFSQKIPLATSLPLTLDHKDKNFVLVSSHKMVKHPLELYSKRIEAIRWFEKKAPEQFDLYGMGWHQRTFSGRFLRQLNRFARLRNFRPPHFPSYRGKIENKCQVMQKYRFSICFENARDIPGYITEKIFDSMLSGCVPIYWGAPNIDQFVPKECYIDFADFHHNYELLFKFCTEMSNQQYKKYLQSIATYAQSEQIKLFSDRHFATILSKEICH